MNPTKTLTLLVLALTLVGCRAIPTPSLTPRTPTPSPTATPPRVATAPPGLIYRIEDELWKVEADGQSRPFSPALTSQPPGGTRYSVDCAEEPRHQCDIWMEDGQTGERRNLTQTPERNEDHLLNSTGASGRLLFCSSTTEVDGTGMFCQLTSVRTDGTEYTILTDRLRSYPTLSPNGRTVAYVTSSPETGSYNLGLLPLDGTPRLVAWEEFGLAGWDLSVNPVSWSPDGNRLAGWAWGETEREESFSGLLVLDLEEKTSHLLPDLHHPVYFDGYPPPPAWSPDGAWLTFFGVKEVEEDRKTYGIWVVSSHHDEIHVLAPFESDGAWEYGGRAWSPDGTWLALTRHEDDPEQGVWLAQAGAWVLRPTDLPEDAKVVGWVPISHVDDAP